MIEEIEIKKNTPGVLVKAAEKSILNLNQAIWMII